MCFLLGIFLGTGKQTNINFGVQDCCSFGGQSASSRVLQVMGRVAPAKSTKRRDAGTKRKWGVDVGKECPSLATDMLHTQRRQMRREFKQNTFTVFFGKRESNVAWQGHGSRRNKFIQLPSQLWVVPPIKDHLAFLLHRPLSPETSSIAPYTSHINPYHLYTVYILSLWIFMAGWVIS